MMTLPEHLREAAATGTLAELRGLARQAARVLEQLQAVAELSERYSEKVDGITGARLKSGESGRARRRLVLDALPNTPYGIAAATGIPLSSVYWYLRQMDGTKCERDGRRWRKK